MTLSHTPPGKKGIVLVCICQLYSQSSEHTIHKCKREIKCIQLFDYLTKQSTSLLDNLLCINKWIINILHLYTLCFFSRLVTLIYNGKTVFLSAVNWHDSEGTGLSQTLYLSESVSKPRNSLCQKRTSLCPTKH